MTTRNRRLIILGLVMGRSRKRPKPAPHPGFTLDEEVIPEGRLELPEEVIELSFYYHFSWGYPDYIRCALGALMQLQPHLVTANSEGELSWKQLRQVLTAADSLQVKLNVASNPSTSPSVLNYLSKTDFAPRVRVMSSRIGISPAPALGEQTLDDVTESLPSLCAEVLLERIAENPSTHRITLERLAYSIFSNVRAAVAENINTPSTVLEKLANDADPDVRYRLAENANMPEFILRRLCDDENPYIASRAQTTMRRMNGGEVVMVPFESRVRSTLTKIRALSR